MILCDVSRRFKKWSQKQVISPWFCVMTAAVLKNDPSVLKNYAAVLQNKICVRLNKTSTRQNEVKSGWFYRDFVWLQPPFYKIRSKAYDFIVILCDGSRRFKKSCLQTTKSCSICLILTLNYTKTYFLTLMAHLLNEKFLLNDKTMCHIKRVKL